MPAFRYEINNDGIAVLTFDLAGVKVNKLTAAVMEEFRVLLDEMVANKDIKALVVRSGKANNFIVGADIAEINMISDPFVGESLAQKGQALMNKLEALPFPTVAAIHGPCMGGGLELALACSFRVVSNDQKTALALPEVKLGILPGFGGTQRLPRLVGLTNALDMILTGKSVYPAKAVKIGLADEATYPELLLNRALEKAKKAIDRRRPGTIRAKRRLVLRLLEGNRVTRQLIYRAAAKTIEKETRGNYPAPSAALDAVRFGLTHGRKAGFAHEAKLLGELAVTDVSKNLISVFYLNELLKKDLRPSSVKIRHAAVLGAGVMGGGIAQLLAEKGIVVRMKDIETKFISAGFREAAGIFAKRRKKGILTAIQARDGFDRITGTTDYDGFKKAEFVVEAVVENMEVKKQVLREFENASNDGILYASNTSSLSITELASLSRRPERVAGMHFFNPVEKMPLVEIIRGKETSEETVAAIATLSRRIGKLPIVVNDGPGFLVNRILMPYLGEAVTMGDQGASIEAIDDALLWFGMPMGAFILLDEIGIDIARHVSEILSRGLGPRVKTSDLLDRMYQGGYFGKKNGKGFYRYDGTKRTGPDVSVYGKIQKTAGSVKPSPAEIVDRTILLMIKEAALCLEEKIIDRPDLLDGALIFGIGFPPSRGGLLRYADTIGPDTIVNKLKAFADRHGERFTPPAALEEMARRGKGFYASFNRA